MTALAPLALILLQARPAAPEELGALLAELRELRSQVTRLEAAARGRDETLDGMKKQIAGLGDAVSGLREPPPPVVAAPFLSGPPPGTDAVGVAKVAVFAPRIEVDSSRQHDLVFLKLLRAEVRGLQLVAEVELGRDETTTDLPIDRNGALYVVEWATSEGLNYSLHLRDGAGGRDASPGAPAATVQVKPLEPRGRFLFVGYRVE